MNKLRSLFSGLAILWLVLAWWFVSSWDISINFSGWCLTWAGTKCFLINSEENRTVLTIAQDVILAATYMVWTVLTLVIIYCGLRYIFEAKSWSWNVKPYKDWLIRAAIWALLVWWAYAIVRLIQYVAKWW